ncbi:MAG: hypothetical protein AABX03_05005 [Nanoarchaeota archaeon]
MKTEIQLYDENDNLEQDIVFDRQVVTRYRYKGSAKPLIDEINYLKDEIRKLKQSKIQEVCILSDEEAKMQIQDLIKRFKLQGLKNIDVIDITNKLNIPIAQVEKIMSELEKEKVILQNE